MRCNRFSRWCAFAQKLSKWNTKCPLITSTTKWGENHSSKNIIKVLRSLSVHTNILLCLLELALQSLYIGRTRKKVYFTKMGRQKSSINILHIIDLLNIPLTKRIKGMSITLSDKTSQIFINQKWNNSHVDVNQSSQNKYKSICLQRKMDTWVEGLIPTHSQSRLTRPCGNSHHLLFYI